MGIAIEGSYSNRHTPYGDSMVIRNSDIAGSREVKGDPPSIAASESTPGGTKNVASEVQSPSSPAIPRQLTHEQRAVVADLKKRDTEVRAHEQAHVAAGGQYVRGGANLEYTTGPDGRKYAVGGEVAIDTSPVPDDPRVTILKMATIKRAALAPAQPSSQDRAIAATADRTAMQARRELAIKAIEEQQALAVESHPGKGTLIALTA